MAQEHDGIVKKPGAFDTLLENLYVLASSGGAIELRTVLMKKNIASVFLASFAVLIYEIILIRYLEFIHFTETSSIVISLALFGFSLSGVFCYLVYDKKIWKKTKS